MLSHNYAKCALIQRKKEKILWGSNKLQLSSEGEIKYFLVFSFSTVLELLASPQSYFFVSLVKHHLFGRLFLSKEIKSFHFVFFTKIIELKILVLYF